MSNVDPRTTPPARPELGRRSELALYVSVFFSSLGFSFATPLMPLLVLELLNGDQSQVGAWVGVAIGIAPALTALTSPTWGTLGDRWGQKPMLQRALITIGLSIAVMSLIDHPWQLVGLRGFVGALGGISVAALAAITASSRRQELGRNIGILQAAQTLGNVAGPLVGGALAVWAGLRPTFVISATLFGLALVLITWLYRDAPRPAQTRTSRQKSDGLAALTGPNPRLFWTTLGLLFVANFLDASFMVMIPLYLPQIGAPAESLALLAGLGLSGGSLTMAASAAISGRLSSRLPTRRLLLGGALGSGIVLFGIVFAVEAWQFLTLRVLLGLVAGGLPTLAYAAAASLAPSNRRGAVVGLASSVGLVGWACAPFLVGLLAGISPVSVFLLDLALVAACSGAYWLAGVRPGRAALLTGTHASAAN